jgi:hypothetical protein
MTGFYTSQTYVNASAQLDSVCNWLESIGVEYSRTRFGKYKVLFSDLAEHQRAGNLDAFYDEYTFESYVNAVHEVAELMRIYEGLNGQNNPNMVTRLRKSLKGHELYISDLKDRTGRDFSLELAMAAKFARNGYDINFGHEADLEVDIKGIPFYVECKRLKSPKKIKTRIKEGLDQLHRRYVKSKLPAQARGLLILSIGKIYNSNLGLLEADNPKSIGDKAFAYNQVFINKYRSYWQTNVDQRTLGTGIVLDTPGILKPVKQLITCHEVAINNSVPINTSDYYLLRKIADHVFHRPPSPVGYASRTF